MTAIEPLKLAGPISAKLFNQVAKLKSETAADAEVFSKFLSSVSTEEEDLENVNYTDQMAILESALEELEQIPAKEPFSEKQELLGAIIGLLSSAIALEKMKEKKPGYVDEMAKSLALPNPAGESLKANDSLQQRMIELMRQIAHQVEELQTNASKEFGNGPKFMGVEKEYSLNISEKNNETIRVLEQVLASIENGQTGELSKQTFGMVPKLTLSLFQKTDHEAKFSAETILSRSQVNITQGDLAIVDGKTEATGDEMLLVPLDSVKAEQLKAPVTNSTQLVSEEIDEINQLSSFIDNEKPNHQTVTAVRGDSINDASSPARPETSPPVPIVRITNLVEDIYGVVKNSLTLNSNGENSKMKVSIFPEHLGHLEIHLKMIDGKVAAQIFTSNIVAKEVLEMQVYQLRNSMVQQGIAIDRIEINQQEAAQPFSQQQDQQSNRQPSPERQFKTGNGYQRLEEETTVFVRPPSLGGAITSIDYTI